MENKLKTKPTVTFHVFRKDGSKNPDIKVHFLETITLDATTALEGNIKLQDGTLWELVLESQVVGALKLFPEVKCIISFQARTYGNYAIARLFDSSKQKKGKA